MKRSYVYLVLAVVGAVLPMSQFVPASMAGEFTIAIMVEQMMSTRILRGVSFDLMVAAVTGIVFIVMEGTRTRIRGYWIALIGTILIGFSFGLPFFLFLWERNRENTAEAMVDTSGT